MGDGPLFHKPKNFLAARQVLYTCIFLGVIQFALTEFNVGTVNNSVIPEAVILVIDSALMLWLIKEMSTCKKWARTVITAAVIIAMVAYPFVAFLKLKTSLLQIALLLIQYALQIYALMLLYKEQCTEWFNSTTHNEMLP